MGRIMRGLDVALAVHQQRVRHGADVLFLPMSLPLSIAKEHNVGAMPDTLLMDCEGNV